MRVGSSLPIAYHCGADRKKAPARIGSLAVFDPKSAIPEQNSHFSGPDPSGRAGPVVRTAPLPIAGSTELELPVERLWETFLDVPAWPRWNPCVWRARVRGGGLREGATLLWVFNPIERRYLYKLPAVAEIVEFVPLERITWEVTMPGFHAVHAYRFAAIDERRCRFGSWEVAEGPAYRALRRFWIAHFRYVCRESLAGAEALAGR